MPRQIHLDTFQGRMTHRYSKTIALFIHETYSSNDMAREDLKRIALLLRLDDDSETIAHASTKKDYEYVLHGLFQNACTEHGLKTFILAVQVYVALRKVDLGDYLRRAAY